MNQERRLDDAAIVEACKVRDPRGFELLVERAYDRVYRVAFSMVYNEEDARDLTQETFTAVLDSIHRFRGESALMSWLVSILRNTYTVWLRRRKRVTPLEFEEDLVAGESRAEEVREHVMGALRKLPERLRTVIVLYHLEDMAYEDIARALECPVGTVRSRLHEARQELKRLLA